MCGIFGIVSEREQALGEILVDAGRRLAYRGYDSVGCAVVGAEGAIDLRKDVGKVDAVATALGMDEMRGLRGIVQLRWATFGAPSRPNAQPHLDCDGDMVGAHNGNVVNHVGLRQRFIDTGHTVRGTNDGESCVHAVETYVDQGDDMVTAIRRAYEDLAGDYAFIVTDRRDNALYAIKKGFSANLDHLIEIDDERLKLIGEVEQLRSKRNEASANRNIEKGREVKEQLEKKEHALSAVEEEFLRELYKIPNPPLSDVPEGDESNNVVLKKVGERQKFDFQPKDHVEIGEALDIIDIPRAAKVSGSRFAYLKGDGVLLELAIVQFALKKLIAKGYTPIFPPALIKQEMTSGLGYWQSGGNENYYLVKDFDVEGEGSDLSLYLVGTGEHSVVPMHAKEVFLEKGLPKKYVAFSPCFRRESGSYGKDTRGILRVHQFDKVEMIAFVTPEEDEKIRAEMLSIVEEMMQELALPYQVVKLAALDLGFPSAGTIDIETWIPTQEKYRETHSISTTTHFQSKRFNIKYQKNDGNKGYVHILNGTAFAIGRILIAILENYQQKDGSVEVPKVLREYISKDSLSR